MDVLIEDISKRYTTGWVIRNLSHHITPHQHLSITGPNGSGKSTLLQIIAGYLSYSKGKVIYSYNGKDIKRDDIYKYCSVAAAYAELDEELTVTEIYEHYKIFKPYLLNDRSSFLDLVDLKRERDKRIAHFSSGMKQRLHLGLSFCMDVPLLLLDEPTSFLDKSKKAWFHELLAAYGNDKTIIIASNDEDDISSCSSNIELE